MGVLDLGKVRTTFGGSWDENTDYELLTIVDDTYNVKYISKQNVPKGTLLSNDAYWTPISGNFVEQYQGAKDSDPTVRNNGTDLQEGDLYFNTVDEKMKVYKGNAWIIIDTGELIKSYIFTADGNLNIGSLNVANAGNITLTLPDQSGFPIFVIDGTGDAKDNPITIARQNSNVTINGSSEDLTCDVNNFNIVLTYDSDNTNWLVGGV